VPVVEICVDVDFGAGVVAVMPAARALVQHLVVCAESAGVGICVVFALGVVGVGLCVRVLVVV
jgi:hypothetical protein